MPAYKVTQRYGAYRDGKRVGPWSGGETVELETELAEWVNRDAPGTLAAPGVKAPADTPKKRGPGRPRKDAS
jgi:hypothetical protein